MEIAVSDGHSRGVFSSYSNFDGSVREEEESDIDAYAFPLTLKDRRKNTPPAQSPVLGEANGGF